MLQEYDDPLIIQPASLDIATVKKKADDEWVSIEKSVYIILYVSYTVISVNGEPKG